MEKKEMFPIGTTVKLKFSSNAEYAMMVNQYVSERGVFFGCECVWHDYYGRPQKEIYRHEVLEKFVPKNKK